MRYLIILISIVLFSGCIRSLNQEQASMLTHHQLCKQYVGEWRYTESSQIVASKELQKRGLQCDMAFYQALRQQDRGERLRLIKNGQDRLSNSTPTGNKNSVICSPFGNAVTCQEY